ncbi:AAA family ATPase [Mycobacterium colombiense]|uniref:AAA family ATPase n=1 Tax=Mycobacterium colombiense TaxID=339268 RepID=UPI0009C1444B|nr:AAA family ATPase [Mycobacterium colombiense]
MRPLLSIYVRNFRSLRRVNVTLGSLNVLVGPNEAGKSNFLDVIEFLGDSARYDLAEALERRGGYDRVKFRGTDSGGPVAISVRAAVTTHSSDNAPDEYDLRFWTQKRASGERILLRNEDFMFKRTRGRGRRITVHGVKAEFLETEEDSQKSRRRPAAHIRSDSLALSTLRRLPPKEGGEEIERFAELFTTFRVFNVDVVRARRPARLSGAALTRNASNLAEVIKTLADDSDRWSDFLADARAMIPGLEDIEFEPVGGSAPAFVVKLVERGLINSTYLADASFGTVRVLALLALLYDPDPPDLTCIEEIDHGLHPYLFDRLVERLREASQRTQILVATHSPALVNRLHPNELIVVERAKDGSTRMPSITRGQIREKYRALEGKLELGELWFSGSLGGVPR